MTERPSNDGRSRLLSPDEIELWTRVTADVRPAPGRDRRRALIEAAPRAPEPRAAPTPQSPKEKTSSRPVPPIADIDHRTRTKLRRGRLEVDAKLDLHGLRQAEAQRALFDFLRRAQAGGARMAIVVTGKGVRSEDGGVLRRIVPMWLQAPQLRDLVVSFGEAARNHGGEGALYVQIRRARKERG
jgi:DNA-nicking Smr family endonuclease